jgi:hypothetical protein
MNYKKITLGFDETWVIDTDPFSKIKQWADTYMPNNYIDWYLGDDHTIAIALTAKDVSKKIVSFALLSLPGVELLETENFETHPDVEHLFNFGDNH